MAKYKLGEICEIVSGSTPKTNIDAYWDGNIKWITPAEITDDTYIINDSSRKITELGKRKTGLSSFPEGTVILSSRAPIGKVAIAGCEMCCNQGFKNLICSEKINNKYLYWFLKGNTNFLNSLGRGATFKEISKKIVSNIVINVPDKKEQIKVVEILEKLSCIVNLHKKELDKLNELIKARFIEMFGGENKYPQRELSEIAKIIAGGDKPKDNSDVKTEEYCFPVYANGVENEGLQCYVKDYRVDREAVTISARGTIGATFLRQPFFTPVVRLITVIPREQIDVTYLKYAIDSIGVSGTGSSQQQLTVPNVSKIKIPIPEIEQQKKYTTFVNQVDKSKAVVQKSLDKTQLLFDSLMQEYFG